MSQGSLFNTRPPLDLAKARAARLAAIRFVGAEARFQAEAGVAIRACAAVHEFFIVDDVWTYMPDTPALADRRAMGAAMAQAVRAGIIERTDMFRPSAQVQCHANPRRVWKSRVPR